MRIRKSNVSSLTLPAGTHVLPVDQSRTVLQTYPQVQMQYGQAGAIVPRQTKYAVSTGVVILQSDAPFTLVSNGSTLREVYTPEQQWVAQLDGAIRYWQLTMPIKLDVAGFVFEFDYLVTPGDATNGLFSNDSGLSGFSAYERVSSGRLATFYYTTISNTLNATLLGKVAEGDTGIKTFRFAKEGDYLTVSAGEKSIAVSSNEFTDDFIVTFLGSASSLKAEGYFKNVRVYNSLGVLTNEIPLTNKEQGATQLATVGDVNATLVGYSEDVWIPN